MNKSISISFFFLFFCSILIAQNSINSYKYILVPKQFEFQKSVDQHQLNSLTKFLFEKAGYTVLFTDDQYPEDLAMNSCLALKVKLNNNPSFLKTKMNIDLYDCKNHLIFTTKEGVSKEKVYKKAYYEAIRSTFVELEELNYAYKAKSENTVVEKVVVEEPKEVPIKKVEKAITVKEVEIQPVVKENVAEVKQEVSVIKNPNQIVKPVKISPKTIEGTFNFEKWGISTISKNGNEFKVVSGDENFELATIYKTSKPTIYIIKWVTTKQPQLVEINNEGNLKVDTNSGSKIYDRVHN
ncbi:MAG: hypothetical protein GQ540_06370 [Lutibacter sp.]|uniref:hypothetical protein n=1 Tax=Lutibacter sp. TaxID=1925666 RepID=UPI001A05F07A|nr:hypothetical protein [Lutibacter sp.]NOR28137.1 hypothetical protein [Lutibacter sp.]